MTDDMKDDAELSIISTTPPEGIAEMSASNKVILTRARELIESRGFGRGCYSHRWGRKIKAGVNVRAGDRGFSVSGALCLASLEQQRLHRLDDEETARRFHQAMDVVISTLYLSEIAGSEIKLHPMSQRFMMASSIIQRGAQIVAINNWNDNGCENKAHALKILDWSLGMIEKALNVTRGPLQ